MKQRIAALAQLACLIATASSIASAQTVPSASPETKTASSPLASQIIADLPILGVAQVSFRVSNLARSTQFYRDVLGFSEAFTLRNKSGQVTSVYFKVNDEQFIELVPGLEPGELVRQSRIVVQSSDLSRLRAIYLARGLSPGPISKGEDGNPVFRIVAPNGFPVDFLQYDPRSHQGRIKGKMLGKKRISTRILHVGTMVKDEPTKAFFSKFGWGKVLPGARGDYIETPLSDRNLETKDPPLDPSNPATLSQYTREVAGAVYHYALEIDNMHAAREELKRRGGFDDVRLRTAVGNNRHWLIHLFDPDGTRTELMSKAIVPDDVPSFSVMPPGPPAPPILATQRGVYPWP